VSGSSLLPHQIVRNCVVGVGIVRIGSIIYRSWQHHISHACFDTLDDVGGNQVVAVVQYGDAQLTACQLINLFLVKVKVTNGGAMHEVVTQLSPV